MAMPTLFNDLPTLEDELNWDYELNRLSHRILNCPTPHVLGIHGDWGSGKTSFMRQLQWRLGGEMPDDGSISRPADSSSLPKKNDGHENIATVWFDAWRYQSEPVPVVALLQEMRQQMATLPMVMEKFKKLGVITLQYTLNSISDVGKAIGIEGIPSAEKIEKLGEQWEKKHHAQTINTDSIRTHLHDTLKALLPDNNARVVVFIDDLDRCNPKSAIRLLEGLKVYLSIPNCVFILGMNERILVDAIREETSVPNETPPEELKLRAAHYLEKICTDIYRLPLPNNSVELLCSWLEHEDQKVAIIQAIGDIVCLPPNPRRLKALANQWSRFAACSDFPEESEARKIWAVRILIAAYIHQFHRDLWERWHFKPDFWNEFKAWCTGERSKSTDDGLVDSLKWNSALKLTELAAHLGDSPVSLEWKSNFPNPGDINIFWIDGLIRRYGDQLTPIDFIELVQNKQKLEA